MIKSNHITLFFMVVILEGYVVLSTEILAIRQTLPYVGSGTDTISIIIAAVLMPLAFGYYSGGQFIPGFQNGRYVSLRQKLIKNMLISMGFLFFGLSYAILALFFLGLMSIGIDNRLILTAAYALLFLVTPVYLLGQTIPLISNYFSKEKLSEITGLILFFSTIGSFMGAVFSTLVLMPTIGVHYTAGLVFVFLAFLIVMLGKKGLTGTTILALCITWAALYINSGATMSAFNIVENNVYNTIAIFDDHGNRHIFLNNNDSSMYNDTGRKHGYIEFAEKLAIRPLLSSNTPKDVLVIGAGGFTFGLEDTVNLYDFVDIDGSLKKIAEEKLLKQKLSDNKNFHPLPIRAFLMKTNKKYDVILMDAYKSGLAIPEQLVTREFFQEVRTHLKDDGVVIGNFITSPNFSSAFSRTIDNTIRSVFPHVSRYVMEEEYNVWNNKKETLVNVMYIYRKQPDENSTDIYTDDKNRVFLDRPAKLR